MLGLGIMGGGMAANLQKAGFPLTVYNRTAASDAAVRRCRGAVAPTPAELAAGCDVVLVCVSDTPDVEAVLFGPDGVAAGGRRRHPRRGREHDRAGGYPRLRGAAGRPGRRARRRAGVRRLGGSQERHPVDHGRRRGDGRRAGPAGAGRRSAGTITHVGPVGAGQTCKLVNQVLVVVNMLAVSEALLLAEAGGLDPGNAIEAVQGGAGGSWMLANRGPQVVARDWRPGFTVDLQQKDLRLVLDAADELGVPLLGTATVFQLYRTLQARGLGGEGNHALVKALVRPGRKWRRRAPGRPHHRGHHEHAAADRPGDHGALVESKKLSTPRIVFLVVAAAAPLAAMVGNVPLALKLGNGPGLPGAFVIATVGAVLLRGRLRRDEPQGGQHRRLLHLRRARAGQAARRSRRRFVAVLSYNALAAGLVGAFGYFGSVVLDGAGIHGVPWYLVAVVGWAVTAVLGYRSVDVSARVLAVLMSAEIVDPAGLRPRRRCTPRAPPGCRRRCSRRRTVLSGALGLALMFAFASFIGFESAALYGEEARRPAAQHPAGDVRLGAADRRLLHLHDVVHRRRRRRAGGAATAARTTSARWCSTSTGSSSGSGRTTSWPCSS